MTLLERIGAQIAKLRHERDLSVRALAERADGMAHNRLSEIETGKTNVTIETLERIARALGCEVKVEIVPTRRRKS